MIKQALRIHVIAALDIVCSPLDTDGFECIVISIPVRSVSFDSIMYEYIHMVSLLQEAKKLLYMCMRITLYLL